MPRSDLECPLQSANGESRVGCTNRVGRRVLGLAGERTYVESDPEQKEELPAAEDIEEVLQYESSRAGGGLMTHSTGTDAGVLIEITGHTLGATERRRIRILVTKAQLLIFLVQLEHAGKTAMLMEA